MRTHGLPATYKTGGCRCGACTEAATLRHRRTRAELARREPPVHGLSGYNNWSCRCEVCFAAKQAANAARKSRHKT